MLIYTHTLESMDASLDSTLDLDIGNYSEEELDSPGGPLEEDSSLPTQRPSHGGSFTPLPPLRGTPDCSRTRVDPVSPVTNSPLLRSDLGGHDQGNTPSSDSTSTARCGEVRVGSHPSRGHPTPKEGNVRSPSKDTNTTSGKE